ncbi:MAG: hypothetical protein WBN07_05605 [Woeseiaceae bacterium]
MNARVGDGFGDYVTVDNGPDNGPTFVASRARFSVEGVMQSVRNFATLSEALRILGAAVILASMSVFLLQGWNEGNDISRYLLLLTQTGLLAAAGFAMSHLVKETKGARIFFGLALVSIPANFTILGALLYSVFQWDGGLTTYPGYASWRIEDVASIGVTLGGAMLVLLPVTLICFTIMARHSAKTLSLHFLVLNALLLLPIRSSLAAGTVGLLGVLYALYVIGKLTRSDRALKTGEGRFALATLFIPLGIILFRSMYFYQVDSLMIAMVAMVLFLLARQASLFPDRSAGLASFLEVLSWPLALTVALAMTDAFGPEIAAGLKAPLFATVYSALALDILRRTDSRVLAKLVGVSIGVFVALSFTIGVAISPSSLTALLSLAAGVLLLLWGLSGRKPITAIAGVLTAYAGVYFGFDDLYQMIVTSSWIDLAIFGAGAIALGSVIDRHGVVIKLRLTKWFDGISEQKRQIALDN